MGILILGMVIYFFKRRRLFDDFSVLLCIVFKIFLFFFGELFFQCLILQGYERFYSIGNIVRGNYMGLGELKLIINKGINLKVYFN